MKTINKVKIDSPFIGKRTGIDFSNHQVYRTETPEVLILYLKKPNTIHDSIKYINCGGVLTVTG